MTKYNEKETGITINGLDLYCKRRFTVVTNRKGYSYEIF